MEKVTVTKQYYRTVCAVVSGSYGIFDRFDSTLFCGPEHRELQMTRLEAGGVFEPRENVVQEKIHFVRNGNKLRITNKWGEKVGLELYGLRGRSLLRYGLLPFSLALDLVTSPIQLVFFVMNPIYHL